MFGLLLLAAGCGGDGGQGPTTTDAAQILDAASSSDAALGQGLTVEWSTNPTVPGLVRSGVTVSVASFEVARLEVIGDAGGASFTTATGLHVIWSATNQPSNVSFPQAPSALYSQVTLRVDGGSASTPSFLVRGTAQIGGNDEDFIITDNTTRQIDIAGYAISLSPGQTGIVPIRLDLRKLIEVVNFDSLPIQNGVRTLDQDSSQISIVRDALDATFKSK